MPFQIGDGTGKAYTAKVDSNNRLHTRASTIGVEMQAVEKGKSFTLYASTKIAQTSATSGLIYIKNTSSSSSIHMTRFFINAEDIGVNRVHLEVRRSPIIDTANLGAPVSAVNKLFSSSSDASIEAGYADGTTNLEFSSLGTLFHRMSVASWANMLMDVKGSIRLNQNDILGFRWVVTSLGAPTNLGIINLTLNFTEED